MKTLNEMQIQVLEAAANPGGASPEGLDHRTVSSLIKKGLISDKRGRGNKHSLVTTPAGMELVQGRGVNAANTASMTSASVGAQAPRPMSHRLTKASWRARRSRYRKLRSPRAARYRLLQNNRVHRSHAASSAS